jgi:hypothetical protein
MSALDPFALGGRQDGDELILAAFREWVIAVRDTHARVGELTEDQLAEADDRDTDQMIAVAEMPAAGAVGLAVKAFLAMYATLGGSPGDGAALSVLEWKDLSGTFAARVGMGLAEDLPRFVPELAPLVSKALAAGREALYEPEDDNAGAAA